MSKEQLRAFLEAVKDDTALGKQLKAAASPAEVVLVARRAGFLFSANAFRQCLSQGCVYWWWREGVGFRAKYQLHPQTTFLPDSGRVEAHNG